MLPLLEFLTQSFSNFDVKEKFQLSLSTRDLKKKKKAGGVREKQPIKVSPCIYKVLRTALRKALRPFVKNNPDKSNMKARKSQLPEREELNCRNAGAVAQSRGFHSPQ